MPTCGSDPVEDDEILLRRIPTSVNWCDGFTVQPEAFKPAERDGTGISLSRRAFSSIEQCAAGRPGKSYWVAELLASDILAAGLTVKPVPMEDNEGHCEIPELTYAERKSNAAIVARQKLARLVRTIHGPF